MIERSFHGENATDAEVTHEPDDMAAAPLSVRLDP